MENTGYYEVNHKAVHLLVLWYFMKHDPCGTLHVKTPEKKKKIANQKRRDQVYCNMTMNTVACKVTLKIPWLVNWTRQFDLQSQLYYD